MSSLTDEVIAYGDYIIGLTPPEREAAKSTLRQYVLAQLPDEEVGKPPVTTLGDYLDNEIEHPPILVEPGLVARGAITAMTARGGKGKTAVSLNRLVRWSMGKPMFDDLPDVMRPVQPLRVLLIENEGAPGHFQKVLRTIVDENGFSAEEIDLARQNIHVWGDGGWSGLKLDDDANIDLVHRGIAATKADIAFVEPFRGLWRGDENSSTEMANVLDRMSELANTHMCGVMLTHHERKSGIEGREDAMSAARGSGALEGAAAVMERWVPVKGGRQRELSQTKWRFDEPYTDVRMEFDRESWSYRLVEEAEGEREVIGLLSQFPSNYFTYNEIKDELDESYANVRRWCIGLAKDDRIRERRTDGQVQVAIKKDASDEGDTLAIT